MPRTRSQFQSRARPFILTSLTLSLLAAALWAQKQTYTTGSLLAVTDENVASTSGGQKHAYLLHILGDSDDYYALYAHIPVLSKDQAKFLKTGDTLEYRIANKDLFIKTPDNKELKANLCQKPTPPSQILKCSGVTLMGSVTGTASK